MDSGTSTVLGAGGGRDRDRLGRLGDVALGHILSFLPATEAARTATLSRRWRDVFAAVHTLSFGESEAPLRMGYRWWRRCSYCDNGDVRAPRFVAAVSAALHGRHRSGTAAPTAPLRALRVAFDEHGFRGGHDATTAVDGWLSYAVHAAAAADALEIDIRLDIEPICERAYALRASGDGDAKVAEAEGHVAAAADEEEEEPRPGQEKYVVPRSIFSSCAALRVLRLGGCWINVPAAAGIALPSLDTLQMTRVAGRRGGIQRLVTACPSLADLTLEACGTNLTELSIAGGRLRRLAIRCCHALTSVAVASPELQAFEYRGAIPDSPPFLSMHAAAPRKISFCAIDFCGVEQRARAGGEVLGLLELFAGVERLHLTSARLGSSFVVGHGDGACCFPCSFPRLRSLEITGMLPDYGGDASAAISTVARILERTPRLETLSLFFLPETHTVKQSGPYIAKEVLDAWHELRYNPHAWLAAGGVGGDDVPCCLRETTREMNLVHYQGSVGQRALAKFLLCNAPMVEEVCWKVARGPLSIQRKLMEEIKGWVVNKSAKMVFF